MSDLIWFVVGLAAVVFVAAIPYTGKRQKKEWRERDTARCFRLAELLMKK